MVVHGPYPMKEERVVREALAAIDAGWEVDVVAVRDRGELSEEIVDGVTVFRLPFSHTQGRGMIATAFEYLAFVVVASAKLAALQPRRRYQVIQVHNPPDFLICAAIVPRLFEARVILDIHDFAPELFATRFAGRSFTALGERVLQLIERHAVGFATAVITAHDTYRRELEKRGVPSEKITVVLNSLDERLLHGGTRTVEPERFRVVYHGTITPHYGVDLLIEAVAQVSRDELELLVEIYGGGDALERVRSRAEELGVSDQVYFSGHSLPHREVIERVRSASAGVICNLATPWARAVTPTKLFEYAALGVPIITADLPGIRENFSSDEVLFFPPGDSDALAEAIRKVAADPDAAASRAQAARRRCEHYRWSCYAERYVSLLERLGRPGNQPETVQP
jgi:glycosyltransferase involved in cell wall biosynthesis